MPPPLLLLLPPLASGSTTAEMSDCVSFTFLIVSSTSRLLAGTPRIGWTCKGAPARRLTGEGKGAGHGRTLSELYECSARWGGLPAMRTYFTCAGRGQNIILD